MYAYLNDSSGILLSTIGFFNAQLFNKTRQHSIGNNHFIVFIVLVFVALQLHKGLLIREAWNCDATSLVEGTRKKPLDEDVI